MILPHGDNSRRVMRFRIGLSPMIKQPTKKPPQGRSFVGWKTGKETEQKSAQIYYMFINHRSEILSMKEQVQLIRGVLAA